MIRTVIIFVSASMLIACVSKINLNTGESDYRIAMGDELVAKYSDHPSLPRRIIPSGESVSIHLKQIFISNFSERWEKVAASLLATTVRGEIAIVARVFELGLGESLDFRTSATKGLGRLIYYTEDVRRGGHLLNQSMLPIYGPIKYNGNPLVLEFTVMELDIGEAQQVKALLSTLANLGAKAYVPASPVLKTLDALGGQLLSGEQDDIELRYIYVLYPEGGHELTQTSYLAAGDYVLMRQKPANTGGFDPLPWDELTFCHDYGRVFKGTSEHDCGCNDVPSTQLKYCEEYREKTYLAVQVNTGFPSVKQDYIQRFSEFQEEMEAQIDLTDFEEKMTAAITEAKTQFEESERRADVNTRHSRALSALAVACTKESDTDSSTRQVYMAELFDIIAAELAESDDRKFTAQQWSRLIFVMREQSNAPLGVSKMKIEAATTPEEFVDIIDCWGDQPGPG